MASSSQSPSSIISLPKGGGAMHGLGEKFSPDLFTGTGNFSVPIALPSGRNGFQPQLNLGYSTGQGNGPYGLGWGLSIPGVARLTSKGIPRYNEQEDIFILSGAEDLVPVKQEGNYTRFRPRTEGLFAQIRYMRDAENAYWEVKTKDGLTSWYGTEKAYGDDTQGNPLDPAICVNPTNHGKIFSWKLTKTTDPFGNKILYHYERDQVMEGPRHWDQIYLTKIEYVDYEAGNQEKFLVSVEFDYDKEQRADKFSEYKAGFEIRTQWRCNSILVTTHPEGESSQKVRKYTFTYDNTQSLNGASLLISMQITGFDDNGAEVAEMPPLEFGYSQFDPKNKRNFTPLTGTGLPPGSLGNPDFELADLDGNGLPDVLQLNGVARYWKNLGNGQFDFPRQFRDRPPYSLSDAGVQMLDADGDGRIDLMVTNGNFSGYLPMEHGYEASWEKRPFRKFKIAPSFNLKDPEVKLIDLTGDGITDVIRSGSKLECFFFNPKEGWKDFRNVPRQSSLEDFPNVPFSDPRVKWADMSGDGIQDLVLAYDGNVVYYPNLGYGNWGKRIHMRNSPRLPYGYDPRRILLGDVDGDGLADLIYVDNQKITLWVNQSGNEWSTPIEIPGTPSVSDLDSVRLVDLKGSGVSGILWSRDLDTNDKPYLYFLDLTGGGKPYVLNEMNNNIGSVTKVEYASSSEFYLLDERERIHRWQTSLPFPVQVVKMVEVIDAISQTKLTTTYRYHHGYWDGVEREFRGFGMVEQMDTLSEGEYNASRLHGHERDFLTVETSKFSPPILTKTWFHQGPIRESGNNWMEADYSKEYWEGDPGFFQKGQFLSDVLKSQDLMPHHKRDALRVLRGSILRSELYALDDSEQTERPYTVTENRYDIKAIDNPSQEEGLKPIYFPMAVSQRSTQWERGEEPMTQFSFTDEYDEYGQPQLQTSIACYRGWGRLEDKAGEFLATRTRTTYALPVLPNVYIYNRVAGAAQWEITQKTGKTVEEIAQLPEGSSMKLFGHSLTFYDGSEYQGRTWKEVGEYGAAVRTEALVLTPEILTAAYGNTLYNGQLPVYFHEDKPLAWTPEYDSRFQQLAGSLGYEFHDGSGKTYMKGYYAVTERKKFDFHGTTSNKGLPVAVLDPLAAAGNAEPSSHKSVVEYDKHQLLPTKVVQVMSAPPPGTVGLEMKAEYNYRVFQPKKVTDPNGNETEFEFSPSGLLVATWIKGQPDKSEGDRSRPSSKLEYDFHNFINNGDPIWVKTIKHIHHDTETDVLQPKRDETIETVEYSDGFGRVVQTRTQAEEEFFGDEPFGGNILTTDQDNETDSKSDVTWTANSDANNPNVVVSGWQVYDNKGQVIEKYEPFFSKGWDYQPPLPTQYGKSVRMEYDPRGHVIRTKNPDGSQQWVIYGIPKALDNPGNYTPTPWEAYTYDANDLASISFDDQQNALSQRAPQAHHYSPSQIEVDALGRTVKAVQRLAMSDAPDDLIVTMSEYDIRGNLVKIVDAHGRDAFLHDYDFANRPLYIQSIDAGKRTTIYDAAGNPVERRDLRGAMTLQTYDDLNRPNFKWASDGNGKPITLREQLIYGEAAPNLLQNNLGKLIRHHDEAGVLSIQAYDFKGNILEKTRQPVADVDITAALIAGKPFVMDWDMPPGLSVVYVTTITYDALNRAKKMTYPQDVNGQRKILKPTYNRAGALEQVDFNGAVYVERIAYNAKGQRILIAYGNQVMTRCAYDSLTFRLLRLRTEEYTTLSPQCYHSKGSALQDFAYQYDLTGNILSIRDVTKKSGIPNTVDGTDQMLRQFTYDAIYRLRSATGRECKNTPPSTGNSAIDEWLQMGFCNDPGLTRAYTQKYDYDKMGNMTLLKHTAGGTSNYNKTYTIESGSNRLLSAVFRGQPFDYFYDNNGNLSQEATSRFYEWDYTDRLVRFRVQAGAGPSQQAAYLYDASGMRVKKLVRKQGGAWESRTYIDGIFEHTVNSADEQNNHLHLMDNQSRIAIQRMGSAMGDTWPEFQYHLGDHLGSSNMVIGGSGQNQKTLVGREEHYPYGDTSLEAYPKKRYRYSGKERDEESSLYYYGARYYAAWLGRWINCDPLGPIDNITLFEFCKSNPILYIDNSGRRIAVPVYQRVSGELDVKSKKQGGGEYNIYGFNVYDYKTKEEYQKAKEEGTLKRPSAGFELTFEARQSEKSHTILGKEELEKRVVYHPNLSDKERSGGKYALQISDKDSDSLRYGDKVHKSNGVKIHGGGPDYSLACATSPDPYLKPSSGNVTTNKDGSYTATDQLLTLEIEFKEHLGLDDKNTSAVIILPGSDMNYGGKPKPTKIIIMEELNVEGKLPEKKSEKKTEKKGEPSKQKK